MNLPAAATSQPASVPPADDRRGFIAKASAVAVGAVLVVCPFLAGVATFFDPLRRKSSRGALIRVASLDAVPEDGTPREFPVLADQIDAWNRYPRTPVGAVYLRRLPGTDEVRAFSVACPHAGCFVGFSKSRDEFQCPCHTSAFALDGAVLSGPSPRGLDELACDVVADGDRRDVWVRFENFFTGRADKRAKT